MLNRTQIHEIENVLFINLETLLIYHCQSAVEFPDDSLIQERSQPYLSGGAKWKNLLDFGLFFPIFPLFLDFPNFPLFSQFFHSFSQFLTIFSLSSGELSPPCPYTGYATGLIDAKKTHILCVQKLI